jgi:hypothetical protein
MTMAWTLPAITDEQAALFALFEIAHHKEAMRQFVAAEREALAAMLVVQANAAREATRVVFMEVACVTVEEAATVVAQEAAQAEELAEEAATKAAARKEMAKDRACWDEDIAAARRGHEIHELAIERCHHQRGLARR